MLITRYLFKNLLQVAAFISISLTMVIWLAQSLKLLELVANSDAPPILFLQLVFLTLPKFLEIIMPLSLGIAVFFTYNKLIMDNELIVLRACGFDQYALARPALALALTVSVIALILSLWATPKGLSEMQSLRQAVKTKYSAFLLREGVFNTFSDKLTIYLRKRQRDGDMLGLVIHDTRNKKKPPVTVTAKRGRVVMEGETPNIIVFDGMRQQFEPETGTVTRLHFTRYTIEINGLEGSTQERWRNDSERTLAELLSPDPRNVRDQDNKDLFFAEANHRISSPLKALSFTLIALSTVLLGSFNRRGQGKRIGFGVLALILVQALDMTFDNLSKSNLAFLPLMHLNTLLPILVGLYLLHPRGEAGLIDLVARLRNKEEGAT